MDLIHTSSPLVGHETLMSSSLTCLCQCRNKIKSTIACHDGSHQGRVWVNLSMLSIITRTQQGYRIRELDTREL